MSGETVGVVVTAIWGVFFLLASRLFIRDVWGRPRGLRRRRR
jgi:hypothetical protein